MRALQLTETRVPTPLAALDARAKITVSLLASVMTIILNSPEAQGVLFAASACYAAAMRRPLLLLAAYAVVIGMLLLALGCAALVGMAAPAMRPVTVSAMPVPFLRLLVMANVILPLAFSTRIQSLLTSLKSFRLPFCIYIPMAVMIRFIPTFTADIRQITEALRIRGFNLSLKQFVLHPVLSWRFVSVPLLFRSLKTSEDLGIAAELKGLGASRKLSPYRRPEWKKQDTALVAAALVAAVAAFICNMAFKTGGRLH